MSINKLLEHISIMPDPRQQGKVEHKLTDILLLTICAVIAGAEGWKEYTRHTSKCLGVGYVHLPESLT